MNDREIVVAAFRWRAARERRLEIGAEKRHADKLEGFGAIGLQIETSRALSQARRREQAALRALGKACDVQRSSLDRVQDVDVWRPALRLGGTLRTEQGCPDPRNTDEAAA